jgi:glycosyltransferase involved in cell wall biosynthesis
MLLREVDLDPERVHLALLGVDARFNEPLPEPASTRVLAVGRDLGRDYSTFATAMRGLDVPATLVASSRNLVGVDLPDNVTVELDVPPARLRSLYAGASCVVVPTRAREFDQGADCSGQTVLLDSMAMGRATVISRRATLDEYIDHRRTAVVVPPEEPIALRQGIDEVLSDDDLRRRLGIEGRARVEQSHTTPLFARRLAEILRSVA